MKDTLNILFFTVQTKNLLYEKLHLPNHAREGFLVGTILLNFDHLRNQFTKKRV
jgi:hypothetical protein